MRCAPCETVANGGSGGPLGAAGARAAAARAPLAAAPGAEAAPRELLAAPASGSTVMAGWAGSAPGVVAQLHRRATQADASRVSGEIGRN